MVVQFYNLYWKDLRDQVDSARSEEGGMPLEAAESFRDELESLPFFVDVEIKPGRTVDM